jgi:uncharacterized protein (DUF3084 family)
MKSILLIFALIISLCSYSQNIDYPKFEIDSLGQQVVVMTIEQAQALDNNSELLLLFEKLNSQMTDYDSVCVKVINDKDNVIASQKMEISNLKKSLENKDDQITSLQGEISGYVKKISILELEVQNRQNLVDVKDKQIKRLKTKMILGGAGGGLAIIGLILGIILIN